MFFYLGNTDEKTEDCRKIRLGAVLESTVRHLPVDRILPTFADATYLSFNIFMFIYFYISLRVCTCVCVCGMDVCVCVSTCKYN